MDGGIYLLPQEGPLVRMVRRPYDSESALQLLLAQYPSLLAGDQIDSARPRRWLLVAREAPLPDGLEGPGRWAVDHLFLDQEGVATLVEVKRSGDSRLRREVVGQMLDYAAHVAHAWTPQDIRELFERRCAREGLDSVGLLADLLERVCGPEDFWEQVKDNLALGRLRLVFVADQIPPELARVVSFLNRQMDPAQVLALELQQYVGGSFTVLTPHLVGASHPAPPRKSSGPRPKRSPTPAAFFAVLESHRGAWEAAVAHRITEWASRGGMHLIWERETVENLCRFMVTHEEHDYQLFSLSSAGEVQINFRWYPYKPPFDRTEKRLALRKLLNTIPEVRLPVESVTEMASLPLSVLLTEPALRAFLDALEWALAEIRLSFYSQSGFPLPPLGSEVYPPAALRPPAVAEVFPPTKKQSAAVK
jgi:hypothetical protein